MRIAVVGAAGYVGQQVCAELARGGHEVLAFARSNGALLLGHLGVRVLQPGRAAEAGKPDAVINLAYAKGAAFDASREDRALARLVLELAGNRSPIVHASSLAVFGYALEHPFLQGPIPARRDYSYVESKIRMENLLLGAGGARELHVVRLGNVWGPASPTWTAALADRLLFGAPVGVAGLDGYSNITDVANAASYLARLATRPAGSGAHFHHLAELGELRWSHWIGRIASELGVEPVYASARSDYPRSLGSELRNLLRAHGPFAIARQALGGRFTASWALGALSLLPRAVIDRLEQRALRAGTQASGDGAADAPFLEIMASQRHFPNRIAVHWAPPVDAVESWARVREWMARAGYDRTEACPA